MRAHPPAAIPSNTSNTAPPRHTLPIGCSSPSGSVVRPRGTLTEDGPRRNGGRGQAPGPS